MLLSKVERTIRSSPVARKKRYKTDLPAQLAECEMNYHRLSRLVRDIKSLSVGNIEHYIVGDAASVESQCHITVLEQTKYTTVVHIMQLFTLQSAPDFIKNESCGEEHSALCHEAVYRGDVRLYHDAHMAEVVKCQRYQSFAPRYEYPNVDMHQIDEKAQMNRFLGELLSHCLSHGRVARMIAINGRFKPVGASTHRR